MKGMDLFEMQNCQERKVENQVRKGLSKANGIHRNRFVYNQAFPPRTGCQLTIAGNGLDRRWNPNSHHLTGSDREVPITAHFLNLMGNA
jgi:hypothetical protein